MALSVDDPRLLLYWLAQPGPPKRLGGVWVSKVIRESRPDVRAKRLAQKRARYAANKERERAKARARYHSDPRCLARKLRRNMTLRQKVRAAKADRRKYLKHRDKALAYQRERAFGLFIGRQMLKFLLQAEVGHCSCRDDRQHNAEDLLAQGEASLVLAAIRSIQKF